MRVKLGESNELKFMLSIKGSTSDPNAAHPLIRFMVTETKTGMSLCFPMQNIDENMVGVTIPDIPAIFREDADYTGKVEVIVGNRYFTPTQVGLVFEREMEVEAAPMLAEADYVPEAEEPEEFDAVIKPSRGAPVSSTLARSIVFNEKKTVVQAPPVAAPRPAPKKPVAPVDPKKQQLKNKLKSLLVESWNELE